MRLEIEKLNMSERSETMMDPEDEAFNDVERMSNIRKESVKMTMLKPKTAEEFYDELRNRVLDEVVQEVLKMKAFGQDTLSSLATYIKEMKK
jgi:hypothetical protein